MSHKSNNCIKADYPLVSVVMNCFNSSTYLRKAIDSVMAQTYSNWELIFWDNQSTDGSAEIFKSYRDARLKYFYAPEHTNLGLARNSAIEKVCGEWCGILDCDDVWLPHKLEKQIDSARIISNVGVIYSDYNIISANGAIKRTSSRPLVAYEGDVFNRILTEEFTVCWPTVLINTDALRSVGSFAGYRLLEDFDILLRLAEKYQFVFVNAKLANYRVHPGQSSTNYEMMLAEKILIFDSWLSRWKKHGLLPNDKLQLLRQGRARAYFTAGINALYYGGRGGGFFIESLKQRYSNRAMIGLSLSLLGSKFAAAIISTGRRLFGFGEYY
jgi:glycosyltransferase involved in cell wall biosynthesis